MNEKEQLAKKLFLLGYPIEKIVQVTRLNSAWLKIKIENWKAQANTNHI